MSALGLLWAQYGPYHVSRAAALHRHCSGTTVYAIEVADRTNDYAWRRTLPNIPIYTLCQDFVAENVSFSKVFARARRSMRELELDVCLLPSYWPAQSLAALLAAKSLGVRTVMMNESHAGTARARGISAVLKRWLVGLFDAALVGGRLQKRYFASLGLPEEKIFTGYDAVDNQYFATRAEEIRANAPQYRSKYDLPQRYFLSLGRFVEKKNLSTLIRAFRRFLDSSLLKQTHLVLVGSGEKEQELKALSRCLGLPVYEKQLNGGAGVQIRSHPGVHFYGFRQIEENPVFYSLADAFVLPSLYEEWGLVANEAMASSLPVVVSRTAGCADDLLESAQVDRTLSVNEHVRLKELGLDQRVRDNGFVFDPASSEELSRVLLFLEALDSRDALRKASRRIIEKFSCENFARNALLAAEAAMTAKAGIASQARKTNSKLARESLAR